MAAHLQVLDQTFLWLLRASAQLAAVVIVVLLTRRALGGRISPGARYALWLLLALPLLAPLLPKNPLRLPRPVRPLVRQAIASEPSPLTATPTRWRVIYEPLAARAAPTVAESHPLNWLRLGAWIWLTGAALLALRVAAAHALALRRTYRSASITDPAITAILEDCRRAVGARRRPRLVAAPGDTGPALLGILRPRLLLPANLAGTLSPDELRFVFLHELIHLKRGDVVAELLLALLQVAHWFNPLVWLAASRCRADREIACDAAVLALTGAGGRADYGRTILRLATELSPARRFGPRFVRSLAPAVGILETHSPLERRLRMIAQDSHHRHARWAVAAVVVFALAAVTCTNAQQHSGKEDPSVSNAPDGEAPKARDAKPRAASTQKHADAPVDVLNAPQPARDVQEERDDERLQRNRQVEAQLDRHLPEVNFDNAGLTDVIDFLRDVSGANIFVNWKALEAAGIDRNVKVTARMRDISFRKALTVILDSAARGVIKLGFSVDDGVITISTDEDLIRNTITRVYDVRDLTTPIRNFDFDPTRPAKEDEKAREEPETTRAHAAEELIRLIRETVEPQRWGKIAQMRELQGQLIVTATKEMHVTIVQLIEQLRETRGVQIQVDSRFIGADDDVLDALPDGLRQKVAGALHAAKEADPKRGAPADKAAAGAPKKMVQYLDDAEVEQLLGVVRANRNAEFLSAPRITLFNGQTAYVLTMTQRAYVADYKIVKQPDGKTTYEPTLATAESGVLIRAGATASADRKFATLALHPRLTYLAGIDEVPWHGNAPGEQLTVQVPKLLASELGTTVSVPDGGTILLGGLHGYVAAGADKAQREPRLQNVILLVKPTLIIQKEVPGPQFPLLRKKPAAP